jgi:hypothetical protein
MTQKTTWAASRFQPVQGREDGGGRFLGQHRSYGSISSQDGIYQERCSVIFC